jgi:transposase
VQKKIGLNSEQSAELQALGKSRGGFGTKIHLMSDGEGLPMASVLSPGQRHETQMVDELLDAVCVGGKPGAPKRRFDAIGGDKGYDSEKVRDSIAARGGADVIPRRGRKINDQDSNFDREKYRRRNVVERLVGKLKEFRAISTRYEKLAVCYHAFVQIACALILMRTVFLNRA